MILKSAGRKGAYGALVNYMLRDENLMRESKGNVLMIRHNVIGKTPEDVIAEFEKNDLHRKYRAKNANRFFHDIVSWHELDKSKLTPEIIADMASKYIELRGSNGMYYGMVHNGEHPHLHLMVSANELEGEQSMRVSKQHFAEIRKELQAYEELTYKLDNSKVNYDIRSTAPSDKEWQFEQRTLSKSRKEELKEIVKAAHEASVSRANFFDRLKDENLDPYTRGKSNGITDGETKYRLSTLGVKPDDIAELDKRGEQIEELSNLRSKTNEAELNTPVSRLVGIDRMLNDGKDL